METWAREGFVTSDAALSGQANAKALGGIQVLDQTIDLIEDLMKVEE